MTMADLEPKASGTIWINPPPVSIALRSIRPSSDNWSVRWFPFPARIIVGLDSGFFIDPEGCTRGTVSPVDSRPSLAPSSGSPVNPLIPGTRTASTRLGIGLPPSRPSAVYRFERSRLSFAPVPGRAEMGPGRSGAALPGRRIAGPPEMRTSTLARPG